MDVAVRMEFLDNVIHVLQPFSSMVRKIWRAEDAVCRWEILHGDAEPASGSSSCTS